MQSRMLLASRSRFTAMSQAATRMFSGSDNFMSGSNANYIDFMYSQWQQDPSSVHASWNAYFTSQENGGTFELPPNLGQSGASLDISQLVGALSSATGTTSSADVARAQEEAVRLTMLLRAYMTHGHFAADVDPLQLAKHYKDYPSL